MAKTATLCLTEQVPAPPDSVFEFFSDPGCTKVLQPYVYKVEIVRRLFDAGVQEIHFRAWEKVPLLGGRWHQRNAIRANWRLSDPPRYMESRGYSFPGVHLHITYTFDPTEAGTTNLSLNIHFKAPGVLMPIVLREGEKAQRELLKNLRKHFEEQA